MPPTPTAASKLFIFTLPTKPMSDAPTSSPKHSLLKIEDLRTYFFTEEGKIPAVDGVNLHVSPGKVLAVVGESGCGKSVTSFSILRLIQSPGKIMGGRILFQPDSGAPAEDILALDEKSDRLFDLRGGDISMIFQEPMSALSPVHTVGNQICEAILNHQEITEEDARQKAIDMLGKVGIPNPGRCIDQYPHELSGGMRQRVVIAMALVCDPKLLIADEPTTALDVTVQAQILDLIKALQGQTGMSVMLITHDLGVIAENCDQVVVMYAGRIAETANVTDLFKNPLHPYTKGLLTSIPSLAKQPKSILPTIKGGVPSLLNMPTGCRFADRCPLVEEICRQVSPKDRITGNQRQAACHMI